MRIAALLLLMGAAAAAAAANAGAPPRILFQEDFEDTNFASRGWYDGKGKAALSSDQHIPGSTKSFEIHFRVGDVGPATPARHLF